MFKSELSPVENIESPDVATGSENLAWKRLGQKVVGQHRAEAKSAGDVKDSQLIQKIFRLGRIAKAMLSKAFLFVVHSAARATNSPLVDIGREYSVSGLNDRINQLEEILVRQWTHLNERDLLSPSEEMKQYIAACHVVRQYDRVSAEQLSARLDISQAKSQTLLQQLVDDEIITESYTVTFHDVRRGAAEAAIDQKLRSLQPQDTGESNQSPASKKH